MAKQFFISTEDRALIQKDANKYFKKQCDQFAKNPQWYGEKTDRELAPQWRQNAIKFAAFEQLKRDGIASIEKIADEFYNFDDLCGDCFDPNLNPDIDPAELRKQKNNYKQRCKKSGVWIMELMINGESFGSIGGFVGNDFYGSGYDTDFYTTAIKACESIQNHYAAQIMSVAHDASRFKSELFNKK